jgi:hypothetical protein
VSASVAIRRAIPSPTVPMRRAVREQAVVAAAQVTSGLGNLAFAVAMAHLLAPGGFAELAAFLALFLLVYVPARSLSAGAALTPELAAEARARTIRAGLACAAVIAAAGVPLSAQLGLAPELVLLLAVTPPLAGVLELERGRLYGQMRHGRVAASLLAEPGVRLTAGVAMALAIGPLGAGVGAVLGSVAALGVARAGGIGASARAERRPARERQSRLAVLTFLLLAVVQTQDVVFANATLGTADAARFAVLSTLGGVAVFATSTVPLVLMPRAKAGDPGAFGAALAAALALGGGAAAAVVAAPDALIGIAFGDRYASVAPIAGPYLAAMALLGVSRVLAADAVARGARHTTGIAVGAGGLQLGLLVALGDSASGVATATLIAAAGLTASLGAVHVARAPAVRSALGFATDGRPSERRRWAVPVVLTLLVAAGIALRLAADRSLWLDEATTWYQSRLPFAVMLDNLRTTDVHPPLHHALVWLSVRALGDGELALRLPSLIAGAALIPMLFVAGRAMYDRRTGLIAAALGTIAPIIVWYSQEARMYALLMLLAVVAVWALHRAVESDRARYWAAYALAGAALVWTHYFAILPVLVLQAALVVLVWRRRGWASGRALIVGALASTAAIALLVAPLAPFAIDQFMANEAAGKGFDQPSRAGGNVGNEISLYAALTNGIWALWGYHSNATMEQLAALWPLLMLLALLILGRGSSRPTFLLIAAATVPATLLTGLALAHPFLFELRYNLAAVPLLVLLGARAIATWPSEGWMRWAVGGLAAATLAAGVADQQLNGRNPRVYDFEGALGEISRRAGPKDVVLYDPETLNNVFAYYRPELRKRMLGGGPEGREVGRARRVFLLSSFRDDPRNVEAVRRAVAKLGDERRLVDRFRTAQVRVWMFA